MRARKCYYAPPRPLSINAANKYIQVLVTYGVVSVPVFPVIFPGVLPRQNDPANVTENLIRDISSGWFRALEQPRRVDKCHYLPRQTSGS